MKTAEFSAWAVDNPVQIPERKNKQEKFPWMAILRQTSLFILCITEMKEESKKVYFLHLTQEVKGCKYISSEIHVSGGKEVKR